MCPILLELKILYIMYKLCNRGGCPFIQVLHIIIVFLNVIFLCYFYMEFNVQNAYILHVIIIFK